jgi:hypothetical protein
MAIICMDGFEHYVEDGAGLKGLWSNEFTDSPGDTIVSVVNSVGGGPGSPYTGDGMLRIYSNASNDFAAIQYGFSQAADEIYVGFALYVNVNDNAGDNNRNILELRSEDGNPSGALILNSSGQILYRQWRYNGSTIATSPDAVPQGSWVYIEFYLKVDNSTGAYELRINGATQFSDSGVDTLNTNANLKFARLGPWGDANDGWDCDIYYDDFVVVDTTGALKVDWPRGIRIRRLDPDGEGYYTDVGGGSLTAWDSKTGADYYAAIDELASFGVPPDTSDYVYDQTYTSGDRVSVTFDDIAGSPDIYGIQLAAYLKNDDAAATQSAMARIGGADYDNSDALAPGQDYAWQTVIWPLSPATSSAWTAAEVNGAEFGVKVD